MADESTIRMYAMDVAVNPPVNGFDNVQDALAGVAPLTPSTAGNVVSSDAPVLVTMDGATHAVSCLIAAPPAWMDNAGHIVEPGMYYASVSVDIGTPPTVGTALCFVQQSLVTGVFTGDDVTFRPLQFSDGPVVLQASDLPFLPSALVEGTTDVTGVLSVIVSITRLAAG